MKLEQPKNYNEILDLCVQYYDGRISRAQLNIKLVRFDLTRKQYSHIMRQARSLSGVGVRRRIGFIVIFLLAIGVFLYILTR